MSQDTVPLAELKHGYLYRIRCRNLNYGVWDAEASGFVGLREKFGHIYPFTEYHRDTGGAFGTAIAIREIEPCPLDDLAEGHSDPDPAKPYFHQNKPLKEWLTEREQHWMASCEHELDADQRERWGWTSCDKCGYVDPPRDIEKWSFRTIMAEAAKKRNEGVVDPPPEQT